MSKNTITLTPNQISRAIEQLPEVDKFKIAQKLDELLSRLSVRKLLAKIDARKARRPTTQEILKEIHAYRKEKHA